jgi:hypothetical protein
MGRLREYQGKTAGRVSRTLECRSCPRYSKPCYFLKLPVRREDVMTIVFIMPDE